jgi:hypothetical protein
MSIDVITVANTLNLQVRPRGTELSALPINYPAVPAIKFYTDSGVMQHTVDSTRKRKYILCKSCYKGK